MSSITITPMSDAVGAVIGGVDLTDLSETDFNQIRGAFNEHGVIFFRDQPISRDDHIAFAERWGPININRFFRPVDSHPKIAQVLKEPDDTNNIGGNWHTDHSYDQIPALGSVLHGIDIPAVGGDTLFAGMGAAYDALSDGFKEMLSGLRAVHGNAHVFGRQAATYRQVVGAESARLGNPDGASQVAVHPVVICHPDTGRKLLYVNPGFTTGIEGWRPSESKMLLEYLYEHIAQPKFTVRFSWEPHSIAMWDNRATWHMALNDYSGRRRYMERITIEGVPIGG